MRPTEVLLRRTARTLPHEQRAGTRRAVRPPTKPDLKDTRTLAPRLPRLKAGLRIRLVPPHKGSRVKTAGYRIVVNDGYASPRKRPVEQIGNYDPRQRAYRTPGKSLLDDGEIVYQKRLEWNVERLSYWMAQGAQPSSRMIWLMQTAGISLDPEVHRQALGENDGERRNELDILEEYQPDILMPNDPKHRARLEMRAKATHYRAVNLEPGSEAWLEAQMQRPEYQDENEFAAAQQEPYPLVPAGLSRHPHAEPSRYAREYPIWIAKASERTVNMRAAALGRDDITEGVSMAASTAFKKHLGQKHRDPMTAPLRMPPKSALTERLARENALKRDAAPPRAEADAKEAIHVDA